MKIVTINFFAILILVAIAFQSKAQIQLQSYVCNDGLEFNSIIQKEISANQKLNYFGYTNFNMDYKNDSSSSVEIYQVANYNLYKNIGLSAGGTFIKGQFQPQVGLYYNLSKKNFDISFIPAISYSFRGKNLGYGFYSLIDYTPKITDKWNVYSMLILESDFDFKEHLQSNQLIRIGLEYKSKYHFGTGMNFSQQGSDLLLENSFGFFVGISL